MSHSIRSDRGYSLIEMVISMAIMLTVTGAIFSLVNPAQGTSRVQPEYSDMQQRARVGADTLTRDLMMAGAGPYQGTTTGSLLNFFPPVMPYRTGRVNPDAVGTFRNDAISIVYVPKTSSQTTIRTEMPNEAAEIKVNQPLNCPNNDPLCGFKEGMSVLIFDPTSGAWDSFEITEVQADALHLQHRGQTFQQTYTAGAVIVEVQNHTYYWDQANLQLRHYDGLTTDVPVLDNVVGVTFSYFGDPNPPTAPKPQLNFENCLFDTSGNPKLGTVPSDTGSLVELDGATVFTDGPWCGAGVSQFDADLFRVRQIRARVRVQASDPGMRPRATALAANANLRALFARPGTANVGSEGFVPDFELRFEVTPRNMNLAR